jgi:hypothetical protein
MTSRSAIPNIADHTDHYEAHLAAAERSAQQQRRSY